MPDNKKVYDIVMIQIDFLRAAGTSSPSDRHQGTAGLPSNDCEWAYPCPIRSHDPARNRGMSLIELRLFYVFFAKEFYSQKSYFDTLTIC